MSLPAEINIEVYRGDDWSVTSQVLDSNTKEPIADFFDNCSAGTIEVRSTRDTAPIVTFLQTASEITFNGSFFTIVKDDASTDLPGGTYRYDLQCIQDTKKRTLAKGNFIIVDDITQV